MVKPRTVAIDCDAATTTRLADAVRAYANAAHPPGGSDCSHVARETLLDTARYCEQTAGAPLQLRRRQISLLRAAVDWYFAQTGPQDKVTGERLSVLLSGQHPR